MTVTIYKDVLSNLLVWSKDWQLEVNASISRTSSAQK